MVLLLYFSSITIRELFGEIRHRRMKYIVRTFAAGFSILIHAYWWDTKAPSKMKCEEILVGNNIKSEGMFGYVWKSV